MSIFLWYTLNMTRKGSSNYPKGAVCVVAGCKDAPKARNMCNAHYLKSKRHGRTESVYVSRSGVCRVDDCGRTDLEAKGLCNSHYYRHLNFGPESLLLPNFCQVCGRTAEESGRPLHVDHDHTCCSQRKTCGKCVRGILCHGCNTSLGGLGNDPERARKLADYIDTHLR